jgi:tetratricopeptide (TPR) repeat protein
MNWGISFFLKGDFQGAKTAFEHSVDFAKLINNEVSEWITKCVMSRVSYLGGLVPIDDFENTLDQAYVVFRRLESTNPVAKRWIKVVQDHKFEVANYRNDLKSMRKYFNILKINQWNKEHDFPMEFHQGQLAIVEKKYDLAINLINKYLVKIDKERILKDESLAKVFYYLGLAYYKNGELKQAKYNWEKGMLLNNEPGNHTFKKKIQEKLELI